MDLMECRKRLDEIDQEIVRLFEERMSVCKQVAGINRKANRITAAAMAATRERMRSGLAMRLSCCSFCCAFSAIVPSPYTEAVKLTTVSISCTNGPNPVVTGKCSSMERVEPSVTDV